MTNKPPTTFKSKNTVKKFAEFSVFTQSDVCVVAEATEGCFGGAVVSAKKCVDFCADSAK